MSDSRTRQWNGVGMEGLRSLSGPAPLWVPRLVQVGRSGGGGRGRGVDEREVGREGDKKASFLGWEEGPRSPGDRPQGGTN